MGTKPKVAEMCKRAILIRSTVERVSIMGGELWLSLPPAPAAHPWNRQPALHHLQGTSRPDAGSTSPG